MRVRALTNLILIGGGFVEVGTETDLDDELAAHHLSRGNVEEVKAEESKPARNRRAEKAEPPKPVPGPPDPPIPANHKPRA